MVKTDANQTISDEQVHNGTGQTWREWLALIDAFGGDKKRLIAIVNYLMDKHGLSLTWAQAIAVFYQREQRLRG